MTDYQLKTPVAFIIFNRPDTTEKVFNEIRNARPPKLLVVADGPRTDRPGEVEKCKTVRAIVERVNWPCDVLTNYSDVNLGCKRRVSSGLDWVFETVEEALILEDDCMPHPTFFRFCEELLEKYRNDERVMMISGDNFQFGKKRTEYSYYFSRYPHIWGWACWRRAWRYYDVDMNLWPEVRDSKKLFELFENKHEASYWTNIFEKVYRGEIDTWDYQWGFTCLTKNCLAVLPHVNLISNIGMGKGATHTKDNNKFGNMVLEPMRFPLSHPFKIARDQGADEYTAKTMFTPSLLTRLIFQGRGILK